VVFIYFFLDFSDFSLARGEAARRESLKTGRIGKMMKLRRFAYSRKKEESQ
jgi:hypothetical protein